MAVKIDSNRDKPKMPRNLYEHSPDMVRTLTEIKTCMNCAYASHVREMRGAFYVVCKDPSNPQGAVKSKINLPCWKARV